MSSASTPRSTRSASPADNSPNMLTPGQKIKAMMAEFDSDSENDSQSTKNKTTMPKLDFGRNNAPSTSETRPPQSDNSSDDSDDAEDIVLPKGRMAARMQGNTNNTAEQESAFSRLSNALRSEKDKEQEQEQEQISREKSHASAHDSSDDELPVSGSKRRNNLHAQRSPTPRDSPAHSRADSPLFVSSPAKAKSQSEARSDNEAGSDAEPPSKTKNARFLDLVAKKRKEREERERVEAEEKAARRAKMEQFSSDILSGEESEADDPGSAQKLSQKARQPRKASKKALEEMSRETQRMSRNMQLAHQAQTKKKITKESLFARFNFMQPDAPPAQPAAANSSSTAGSQNSSDAEGQKIETPRTSPVLGPADGEKPGANEVVAEGQGGEEGQQQQQEKGDVEMTDLPPLEEVIADTPAKSKSADSIPAIAPEVTAKSPGNIPQPKEAIRRITPPSVRVLMSRQEVAQHQGDGSDSDDLEVITSPAKCRRIAAFENLPSRQMQESSSMTKLKALAHLTSPNRQMSSMSSAELSASLLYKARQQAAKDRRERIEELRAKGVVIETAEERAAMEDNVEDLVEKARQEADEIAREERAARRKAKGLDADDEEDDDDYAFSGSDDDASGEDEEDEEDGKSASGEKSLFEQEADEADESSGDESEAAQSEPEIQAPESRRKRRTRIVSDDEDEHETEQQIPSTPVRPSAHVAQSAERPQFPGMQTPDMSLGLTQAFAGTLADDAGSQPASGTIPFSLPDPGRPVPRLRAEDSEILVKDSQEQFADGDFMPAYSQNMNRVSESPAGHGFSQFSQIPDPTQDEGFVFSPFDPSKRFRGTPPVSTIDTVIVGQSQSPVAERKGRQLRRGRAANLSAVEEEQNEDQGDFEINANAFNVMKKAAKKPTVPYDKKNSKAKGVVDEAAEESEDEYAGIGGASDDSDGEEDVRDLQMINDNSGEVVDEKQLAALNATHQRNRDEKDVAKLLKDITTGALRRRRGADDDLDLDDSDDERVARRREKQREFARMRKALLADDKVGELAENPKKAAFFKAIEDREDQDDFELEFLEEEKEGASQGESSQDVATDKQVDESKKRKRPLEPSAEDATNRPPPHLRRTPASAMSKKPANLAEVRETLSFLTETHDYDSFHEDASVDEEDNADEEDSTNASGTDEVHSEDAHSQSKETFAKPSHPRRTRGTVIDRLALLRQASSNSASTSTSNLANNSKMAFHGGSSDAPIGFRPPQLLRRVTSGSSSSNSTPSSSSSKISKAASGPKKGGAVNSYTAAREQERERQLRAKQRNGGSNIAKLLSKHAGGGLGSLAGKGQWD